MNSAGNYVSPYQWFRKGENKVFLFWIKESKKHGTGSKIDPSSIGNYGLVIPIAWHQPNRVVMERTGLPGPENDHYNDTKRREIISNRSGIILILKHFEK